MNKVNVLIAGSTGYINSTCILCKHSMFKLNIFVEIHQLGKKYIFMITN